MRTNWAVGINMVNRLAFNDHRAGIAAAYKNIVNSSVKRKNFLFHQIDVDRNRHLHPKIKSSRSIDFPALTLAAIPLIH